MNQNIITEQCGAVWNYEETGLSGDRAYWIQRTDSKIYSVAKPNIIGFYATSLTEAANKLNN
jgi:hypothetical protein